ncbi:uncharacterized protein LOC120005272 isoform X1 [Tripterygium wilfordii]|uniref:uncharacterized protein LOC120005272 isoform X1 n=1 Tax=Tripterygium wilfordii TaxID=458696 RepID=UPI0018F82262|nr:uncharacterized protein LOC120005272 isoform X1 [Tripterygium wilfordii]
MLLRFLFVFYVFSFIVNGPTFINGDIIDSKILTVGEELWKETLPLQSGSRLYQLKGIKPSSWYEVKISYPASIPARFSVELKKDSAELGLNRNRRLLNTEKLIFKTDGVTALNNKDKVFVLVTVEPEGFVAIPHVPERKFITYNIVCDELLLGIPHKAWWVAIMALLCLTLAFIIPRSLPSYLLPMNQSPESVDPIPSKKH